jgi:hypothetical protein
MKREWRIVPSVISQIKHCLVWSFLSLKSACICKMDNVYVLLPFVQNAVYRSCPEMCNSILGWHINKKF